MISEKRSQTARANGARSRGPVTPEGKAISARNALRHGLLARTLVLLNENPKTFEDLFYLLVQRFSPVDDIEMSSIEEMAAAHWRMRRVMSMERAILDAGIERSRETNPAEQTADAFSDPANQATLVLLQRYEARFQNMYNRALRTLIALRKLPAPNEPKDPYVCNTQLPVPTPIRPDEPPAGPPAEPPDPPQPRDPFIVELSGRNLQFVLPPFP
jgi:hypothetical protein